MSRDKPTSPSSQESSTDEAVLRRTYDLITLKIVQIMNQDGPFAELLHTLLSQLSDCLGASRVVVLTTTVADPEILYVMGDSQDPSAVWLSVPLSRYPEVMELSRGGEPLFLLDGEQLAPAHQAAVEQRGTRALAVIPLMWNGESFGAMEAWFSSRRRLHLPAQDSLRLIGAVVAQRLHTTDSFRSHKEQTSLTSVTMADKDDPSLPVLRKYREFFQRASEGIMVLDGENSIQHINPIGEAITGYARRGLVGTQLSTIVNAQDHATLASQLELARSTGAAHSFELGMITTSQDTITVSVSTSAVLSDEGVMVLSFRDVTEERQLAEELRSTKVFLERLIDSTVDAIIVTGDHDGVILFNKGAERILGAEAQEVVGRRLITDLFAEEEVDRIKALLWSHEHGGRGRLEAVRTEAVDVGKERVPVSLSASLLYEEDRASGMVVLFSDLTDRLIMEQRLAQAQERLMETEQQAQQADLAGITAHELNQPLTSVMGYAELLKRRMDDDDENMHAVKTILQEAERLADIVRKIGQIIRFQTRERDSSEVYLLKLDESNDNE